MESESVKIISCMYVQSLRSIISRKFDYDVRIRYFGNSLIRVCFSDCINCVQFSIINRVGLEVPKVEVRYENLKIVADVQTGARALPTLVNASRDVIEVEKYVSVLDLCFYLFTNLTNRFSLAVGYFTHLINFFLFSYYFFFQFF
jgi:hypothetical protein